MRYAFFGTPRFAALVLEELLRAGLAPTAVVANPDRPAGRKGTLTPPSAKIVALAHGIPVLQPERPEHIRQALEDLGCDVFLVAAYAHILKADIISLPRAGTVGVHPSLLPAYRGSSPIQSAILAGEGGTGVTLYVLDEKMDHGPVLAEVSVPLAPEDDYPRLEGKLANAGGVLAAGILPRFIRGEIEARAQNESEASYTRKFKTDDAFVDPADLARAEQGEDREQAVRIDRMIRAFHPEPGAWTRREGKRVKLLSAAIEQGRLVLKRTQEEGGVPRDNSR